MFVAVICLCIIVGHLLVENRWINESITAIVIGCITGTIILFWSKGTSSHILRFDEQLFFMYLLPPIIFNAGFQVKKKKFFHNFFTIILFGVVGVFISFVIISAGSWWLFPKIGFHGLDARDFLALGVIFSSTDTVCTLQVLSQDETPLLYSLVFGEGVVNDATAVVLFNAIRKIDASKLAGWSAVHVFGDFLYLFSTSTILGIATGLGTAYCLKVLYFGKHSTDREIALMVLMAYLSYMLAELLNLSGILTVFFCGIIMSHYAWHNVTVNSKITTRHIFATLSFIAETFIFLYVGMDALDIEKWKMTITNTSLLTTFGIYFTIIALILVGRATFVFLLSSLSNYFNSNSPSSKITFKRQVIIWWAGLMRGAVSIALAFSQFTISGITSDPVNATMITSTIVVVLFTTLIFGFLTKPLINFLLPHRTRGINSHSESDSNKDDADVYMPLFSSEDVSGMIQVKRSLSALLERPVHTIHVYWRKFDDNYMRPIFGGPS
ncbi:solute carrier family 9 (sodium/hydrogen exchanger) member 8 protein [Dioscorea alata]|uniref:Solute carrier family 9 (Sodium/hydrogen exchanger) member 8 protein n=1 Tax=Dioscorea alata TaxID=55571 RepID=A0ACB7WMQ3_DIOAL|nr:solute carrier family 9 (sodium/hydrogen exchanger) member 8 protein [Dioscorea alata]